MQAFSNTHSNFHMEKNAQVSILSPSSKPRVLTSARKRINNEIGYPAVSEEFKQKIIHILERPNILHCKPGKSATVYWGKMIKMIKFTSQNITFYELLKIQ